MVRKMLHRKAPRSSWYSLLCLAMVAFVLRALVPAGFMPHAAALAEGRFEVTFCTAGGELATLSIPVAATDDPAHRMPECPYGLLASQALTEPPPSALPVQALPAFGVSRHSLHASLPPLPPHGPPLGSRAPPSHLG